MSVYPISVESQTPLENMSNLICQSYIGYTFKYTVAQHLKEAERAYEKTEKRLLAYIENAKTDEERAHWNEAMEWFRKEAIPEPHDCNIDYDLYMASKLPLEEVVENYGHLTIGDMNKIDKEYRPCTRS